MSIKHGDYTVAWICALPLEMTAAKAMLDRVHPSLPQPETDHNVYTLGNVSGHNVVVACLPSGVYGTTSAAIVLAHMLPTFPSLRFALMVGVGGGVPSNKTDIRLGDVVVSIPTAASGGVIQYDYGKTVSDGCLQRIGSLNKPPQYLLTAVSQVRSDYMARGSPIKKSISEMLQKQQMVHRQFSRPNQDWLFKIGYDHESKNADCSLCDQSQLVVRTPRETDEPLIHYGLIASGNQVMKNAKIRDSFAQELGILCFEMEAAGLIDQLPCLVIRGICDYCDSHKHKQWQGYAALTAATYARTLLEVVPLYGNNPSGKRLSCWMVPFARNPRFVGRQNVIDSLEQSIFHSGGPTKTAIYGLGGIGKTQVALELAYRAREKVPGISIFWIPCTSYENAEQAYLSVASSLGMTGVDPADVKEQVKIFLSQGPAGKWLLIFDNADDMEMWTKGSVSAPPLKDILPQSEDGHILFTTRNRKLAVKLASPNVLPITEMDHSTAREMLDKILIQKRLLQDDCSTTALLKLLGFLPLAISQAAAYINENDILLSEYLSLLGEQEKSAIEMLSEDFEDHGRYAEIQNPVATTWIAETALGPEHPRTLTSVSSLGLVLDREGKYKEAEAMHRRALEGHEKALGSEHPNTLTSVSNLGLVLEREGKYKEAEAMHRRALEGYEKSLGSEHSYTLTSANNLGLVLEREGKYAEAEAMHRRALEGYEKALGSEHPNTLTSVSNLGLVLDREGNYKEAEAMHRRALEGYEKALGSEHPYTLASANNLGLVLDREGKYKEAEAMHRRALEGYEKALGSEHPNTPTSVSNLGLVLEREGKYAEAEVMHRRALEGSEKAVGPEHPNSLTSVSNLGSVLERQGRYEEALAMHRLALEGREKVLGQEHPDIPTSVSHLASVLERQGKYGDAEAMHRRALEGRVNALGPKHPDTLTSVSNLGLVLARQEKYDEAEDMHRRALEGRVNALGPEHPDTLTSASNLNSVLGRQGKHKEA
ncbi:hypothetical protein CNMCM6069_002267 [Aspergillus lentulus]|nr:hypothetical protein CNMCM6069_002267 [Aspergillus lentulus]